MRRPPLSLAGDRTEDGMNVVYARCCGLDVHKKSVTACLLIAQPGQAATRAIRTFSTMPADLVALRQWLVEEQVEQVAMESTGVYWKPVWNLLESHLELLLVNPAHMKAVPGRKTDVKDAEWIAELLQHGLLHGSFVPSRPDRELRELTRYRSSLVQMRSAESNRLHKGLEGANIKLGSVVSDVLGVSSRAMLAALIAGAADPAEVADLAQGQLRKKRAALQQALPGALTEHQRFLLTQQLTVIDTLTEQIETVSQEIAQRLTPFDQTLANLDTIPGVGIWTAQVIVAEIGLDMSRFPTAGHLSSWAGMAPGHDESAGKQRSGKTRKGSPWLRVALTEAAYAAGRSTNTYLSQTYHRLIARRGKKKAAVAVGRIILELCYQVIQTGQPYDDQRWRRPDPVSPELKLIRQLEKLGHRVTLDPAA
ncbi:MAG: IS110 family transposase [Armatimonas sp.]